MENAIDLAQLIEVVGIAVGSSVVFITGIFWRFYNIINKKHKETIKILTGVEKSVNGDLDKRFRNIIKEELSN